MIKMKKLQKININNYFRNNIFNEVIQYGNRFEGLNGVCEINSKILEKQKMYNDEINQYVIEKKELLKKKLLIGRILKVVFIFALISFVLSLPYSNVYNSNFFVINALLFMTLLPFMGRTCLLLGCFVLYKIGNFIYEKEVNKIKIESEIISRKYETDAQIYYKQIDDIYLSSLEPMQRYNILSNRDQERRHQEMLREQREHNRRLEEEQRRTRLAQEEILRIEREREERRRY